MGIGEMNERQSLALSMRATGATWAAIGSRLGVTRERARQICLRAEYHRRRRSHGGTIGDLSVRSFNALVEAGVPRHATREDLKPQMEWLRRSAGYPGIKNFGRRSLAEVENWIAS